ncbi:MAG: hypothetical protein K0S53_34 [Bacteroidetes bacterium]|jgi:hypothetical protein|nr:hypothetical protein [Bacteroidota bacterium]
MRIGKSWLSVITLTVIAFVSCKKEPEQSCSSCPVGGITTEPVGFTYSKNGGSDIHADSAFFNSSFRTITSYYHGIATRVNIKTSSQVPGTYTLTSSVNTLSYSETSFTYMASGGCITISDNANNKISGNFVSNGGGGGITSLTGRFKDVPRK